MAKDGFLDTIEGIETLHDIGKYVAFFLLMLIYITPRYFSYCAKFRPNQNCLGKRNILEKTYENKIVNGVEKKWEYMKLSPYEWINNKQFYEFYKKFGSALMYIGFKPKEHFAIFEDTCLEWNVAAQGVFRQNMSILTVYSNLGESALEHSLHLGEVKGILVNGKSLKTILHIADKVRSLKYVVATGDIDEQTKEQLNQKGVNVYSYSSFLKLGEENEHPEVPPEADDVALIMFTSGTTGVPKGVVLTHRNVIAAIAATLKVLIKDVKVDPKKDRYLSFLPLAHILAFVVYYCLFYLGVPVGYGHVRSLMDTSLKDCKSDLKEFQPTFFVGVPSIFERIKSGIENKLRKSNSLIRTIFRSSVYIKQFLGSYRIPVPLIDRIVFNRIKNEMGGKVRLIISGGAALSPDVNAFIRTVLSTKVLQGYGLTETCGPVSIQAYHDNSLESVGIPITSVELKLVDIPEKGYSVRDKPYPRGEIWVRGTNVSSGYYKNEEETKKAFVDGWFRTGDIGMKYPDGTFAIIDRLKNLVKASHGEYIALENLETIYKSNEWVSQILIYVDSSHDKCVALIVPNEDKVMECAEKNGLKQNFNDLCKQDMIRMEVKKSLNDTANKHKLRSIEHIRNVVLIPDEWTVENDLLTAGHKMKRDIIIERYRDSINRMYRELGE